MLNKTLSTFFLTISRSFFMAIVRRVLKVCCTLFKKIFEKKKFASTVLFVPWLRTYQCKEIFKNCNSVGTGAHRVEKVFSPTLIFIFLVFEECEKGKFYIWNKKFNCSGPPAFKSQRIGYQSDQ